MKPSALVMVTGDPRQSARPAEAIRIAAGVGTWRKIDINLYLRGPAVLALSEFVDDFVDEDNYVRYLPILTDFGRVYVARGEPLLQELGESPLPYEEVNDQELAALAARHTYVLRF